MQARLQAGCRQGAARGGSASAGWARGVRRGASRVAVVGLARVARVAGVVRVARGGKGAEAAPARLLLRLDHAQRTHVRLALGEQLARRLLAQLGSVLADLLGLHHQPARTGRRGVAV